MRTLITVIICTYNRAPFVRSCLEALDRQDVSSGTFCVVVVNNGSTDDTAQVVAAHMAVAPYALSLTLEQSQGASHARNRGARESATPWLAFLDDDARPHADWVRQALEFIASHPDAAMFGGPILPDYLDPPPAWLPAEVGRFWHGDTEVRLPYRRHFLGGGNFLSRRDVFEALGGFDPCLGPCGEDFHYGEDTAFYRNAINLGYHVYYTPRIVIDHWVRPEKYCLSWHVRSLRELGRNLFRRLGPAVGIPVALCLAVVAPVLTISNACVFMHMPIIRRAYYALHPLCYTWGMLQETSVFVSRLVMRCERRKYKS